MRVGLDEKRGLGLLVGAVLVTGSALALEERPARTTAMRAASSTGSQAVIAVKGLACPFCVFGLKKHLSKVKGVTKVEVSLGKGEAVVDVAPGVKVSEEQLERAVRRAGFTPGAIRWRPAAAGGRAKTDATSSSRRNG